jgi:hypothetical protein
LDPTLARRAAPPAPRRRVNARRAAPRAAPARAPARRRVPPPAARRAAAPAAMDGADARAAGGPEGPQVYAHESPSLVYALAWSLRPDRPFRLAVGSFVEDYQNRVEVVQRACF